MLELLVCSLMTGGFLFFLPSRIDGDEIYCFYALALIAICSFFMKPVREIPSRRLGLVMIVAMASLFFNFNWPCRAVFMNLFFGLFALKSMAERLTLSPEKLGKILLGVAGIQLIFLVLQFLKLDSFYSRVYPEPAGTFLNPWQMGCFAVIALPFIFRVKPVFCVLLLPILVISKSWTNLGLGAFLFALMMGEQKRMLKAGLILVPAALIYLLIFGHDFDLARPLVWAETSQYMKNLWLGNGLGSWAHMAFLKENGLDNYHWRWAHNEFYQHFFEQGWIGIAAIIPALLMLSRSADRTLRVAFTGIFILSFAHPILHFGRLITLIVVILAMILAEKGRLYVNSHS